MSPISRAEALQLMRVLPQMGMYGPPSSPSYGYHGDRTPPVQGRSGTPRRQPRDSRTPRTPTLNGNVNGSGAAESPGSGKDTVMKSGGDKAGDATQQLDEDFVRALADNLIFTCIILIFF